MSGIGSVVAGGVPVGFRVTWDRIVPGLESIPADMVPLDDATHDLGSADKGWAQLFLAGTDGIDFTPGSDVDVDLLTVNVTTTPRVFWDESASAFSTTNGLILGGSLLPVLDNSLALGSLTSRWATANIVRPMFGVQDGITASTTQTQGQQPLTIALNRVSTVANANDVVTLPVTQVGMLCAIRNDGANTLQIFPRSGSSINGGATDASITLAAGSASILFAMDATSWYSFGAL